MYLRDKVYLQVWIVFILAAFQFRNKQHSRYFNCLLRFIMDSKMDIYRQQYLQERFVKIYTPCCNDCIATDGGVGVGGGGGGLPRRFFHQ